MSHLGPALQVCLVEIFVTLFAVYVNIHISLFQLKKSFEMQIQHGKTSDLCLVQLQTCVCATPDLCLVQLQTCVCTTSDLCLYALFLI